MYVSSSMWPCWLAIWALLLTVGHAQNPHPQLQSSLRINSPRSGSPKEAANEDKDPLGGSQSPKLVKLPSDLEAVLHLQKQDRKRIHASILGLAPNGADLEDILGEDVTLSPAPASTSTTPKRHKTTSSTSPAPPPAQTSNVYRRIDDEKLYPRHEEVPSISRNIPYPTAAPPTVQREPTHEQAEDAESEPSPPRSVWAIAWEAHIYFSGTLFVLLAVYCSVNILRLHTFSRLFSRGYFVALNLCIIICGVLRPVLLFHDPYNENLTLPRVWAYLLLDTGFPCVTTAFAVLFLALLRATQIELVSPSFQTPRSLGIFCGFHFALSIGVDVAIGISPSIRYTILICQGFFIVWSLLLSAGYFYIFSALKKVSLRMGLSDPLRYPKLVLGGGDGTTYDPRMATANSHYGGGYPMMMIGNGDHGSDRPLSKPPLTRAVHLTLGVAVLGSLMGGVQLFGMIKMLGLQKIDMSNPHNEPAWYGYQVSMRILEVAILTLLAVVATTPLRSDPGGLPSFPNTGSSSDEATPNFRGRKRRRRSLILAKICCCLRHGDHRELEDEIYSEICTNNQSVRQLPPGAANGGTLLLNGTVGGPSFPIVGNGDRIVMQMGTMGRSANREGMDSELPYGYEYHPQYVPGDQGIAPGAGNNPTLRASSAMGGDFGQLQGERLSHLSSGQPSNAGLRASSATYQSGSMASSRATLESALYSNIRGSQNNEGPSRPSSLLFNDSGFVRFRIGGDQSPVAQLAPEEMVLAQQNAQNLVDKEARSNREKLRASQSFDDNVLLMDHPTSPSSQPPSSPGQMSPASSSSRTGARRDRSCDGGRRSRPRERDRQSPIYRSIESLHREADMLYEAPPGMKLPKHASNSQNQAIYSPESEMSSEAYGALRNRPPSRCSSVSATQSFDLRMYGRTGPGGRGGAVTAANSGTSRTKGTEESKEKLENPYYYYGSTRNQKKVSALAQKPKPLLPSQRQQLELQARQPSLSGGGNRGARGGSMTPQFQRSRSLGGYYQRGVAAGPQVALPPSRNQQHYPGQLMMPQAVGSMTPMSYARWQHAQEVEQGPRRKRHNPLYDTPPTARSRQIPSLRGGLSQGAVRRRGPPPGAKELLSPILTDSEVSPLRKAHRNDSITSSSSDDDVDQATQGYSEGLADNESEVSAMFDLPPSRSQRLRASAPTKTKMSPLEYSAMLKLNMVTGQGNRGADSSHNGTNQNKDITPDSGVNMEGNNTDSNGSRKKEETAAKSAEKQAPIPAQRRRLSSSSSLNDLMEASHPIPPPRSTSNSKATAPKRNGDYSQVSTNAQDHGSGVNNTSVFSSSSSASSSEDSETEDIRRRLAQAVDRKRENEQMLQREKRYHPLVSPPSSESNFPAFSQEKAQTEGRRERSSDGVIQVCKEIQEANFGIGNDPNQEKSSEI